MKRKALPILAIVTTLGTAACTATIVDPTPTNQAPSEAPSARTPLDVLNDELSFTPLWEALERRDHFRPLCDANGFPLVGNINSKGSRASDFCAAVREREVTVKSTSACDSETLNEELGTETPLDQAIVNRAHFRCLCDEQGYPLVGNINVKGTPASLFCKTLRDKNLL